MRPFLHTGELESIIETAKEDIKNKKAHEVLENIEHKLHEVKELRKST